MAAAVLCARPNKTSARALHALLCVVAAMGLGCSRPSNSDGKLILDNYYTWQKGRTDGDDIAYSRADEAFNYIVLGDLSHYSLYLVQQYSKLLAGAAGLAIDRQSKRFPLLIFHQEKVFDRLRNDRNAFRQYGMPDAVIDQFIEHSPPDTQCHFSTFTDEDKGNVEGTILLLGERYHDCLIWGLFRSFGVVTKSGDLQALVSACMLYEARRIGIRNREGIQRESARLADVCLRKSSQEKQ